jgi:hypothetical protein
MNVPSGPSSRSSSPKPARAGSSGCWRCCGDGRPTGPAGARSGLAPISDPSRSQRPSWSPPRGAGEGCLRAHAGGSTARSTWFGVPEVPPRARGRDRHPVPLRVAQQGASARMRARQSNTGVGFGPIRCLRAHVGETTHQSINPSAIKVPPRAHGGESGTCDGFEGLGSPAEPVGKHLFSAHAGTDGAPGSKRRPFLCGKPCRKPPLRGNPERMVFRQAPAGISIAFWSPLPPAPRNRQAAGETSRPLGSSRPAGPAAAGRAPSGRRRAPLLATSRGAALYSSPRQLPFRSAIA